MRFHFISVYYILEEILKMIDEVKNSLERTLIFAYFSLRRESIAFEDETLVHGVRELLFEV